MGDHSKPPAAERLTKALKDAKAPDWMIEQAQKGFYGDFTSPLAMPIHRLVSDLTRLGFHDLAKRARAGEFDG